MPKSSDTYLRPLVQVGPGRPEDAHTLAGGWGWFRDVEILARGAPAYCVPARDLSAARLAPFVDLRPAIAGLEMNTPRIMGILNATPDSFSDGGVHAALDAAVAGGLAMIQQGADILDIGGESTRPGAQTIDPDEEIARTAPLIKSLRGAGAACLMSIDTRKAAVATAAVDAGAGLINDVSGFTFDPALAPMAAARDLPVCVMHAAGDPATMQDDPTYDDVVLDVYDFLATQIAMLEKLGIPRFQIIADPGIGFGKTTAHNLALLARISVFHGLGVPILLGASRKRFIGQIGGGADASARMPGSIAVALAALAQGVQIIRAHDVVETRQAIALWYACVKGSVHE